MYNIIDILVIFPYNLVMRYYLDASRLKELIKERGYSHLTAFAKAHGFNRATLNNYTKGRGGPLSDSYYEICEALKVDPLTLLLPSIEKDVPDISEIMPIVQTLCEVDTDIAIGILGSRAKGCQKKYSDWDLGITRRGKPLGGVEFLRLKRRVEDLVDDLPREVDFVNLDAAPEWFLLDIDYEPKFLAGNSNAWSYFLGVWHGTKKNQENVKGAG